MDIVTSSLSVVRAFEVHDTPDSSILAIKISPSNPPRLWRRGVTRGHVMSQQSKLRHSREQWKRNATERAAENRYLRKELARMRHERDRLHHAHRETQERFRQHDAQTQGLVVSHKVDLVWLALRLFLEVRISFRAVSRVLQLLAEGGALMKAPGPQTVINGVMRLAIVRGDTTRALRGLPLRAAPFSNGGMWMIDISIGLGTGKILAVVAIDAQHHRLRPGAPSLEHARGMGGAVADAWPGDTIAAFLKRLIARVGRPAAYLKDGGRDLRHAVVCLEEHGLGSPCIDDMSHAVASMRKRSYQDHPAFETFVSACGRVSRNVKQTILACLAPPKVRTKARFMNVHRLFTWADQVLRLSPSGGAKTGSTLAKLRACLEQLPACKALITRFRRDADGLLACQQVVKMQGLSHAPLAQCEPLLATMPSAALRRECHAYLVYQLETATTLGLEHIGLPISSDTIESLFGVAKRHGVGETQDASRMALRLPAFCGVPTREEAQQVLEISVARQRECTAQGPSLTTQRREVLGHPERRENLSLMRGDRRLELIPPAKNRSNDPEILHLSNGYKKLHGPQILVLDEPSLLANAALPDIREVALIS